VVLAGAGLMYQPPVHIAILNKSSSLEDVELALWIEAYREQVRRVADAWGLPPPGLAAYVRGHHEEPDPAVAALYIVDTAGNPDALGYHTVAGRSRFGYVDMTLSRALDTPSVVFGHELYELFIDADCNRWAGPYADGTHVAIEVCDPVQRDSYAVEAEFLGTRARVPVADFVLPAWFDLGGKGPYAYSTSLMRPLEDSAGGYHLVERDGVVVSRGAVRLKSFGRTLRRLVMGRRVEVG
jgi:hypothetical protein